MDIFLADLRYHNPIIRSMRTLYIKSQPQDFRRSPKYFWTKFRRNFIGLFPMVPYLQSIYQNFYFMTHRGFYANDKKVQVAVDARSQTIFKRLSRLKLKMPQLAWLGPTYSAGDKKNLLRILRETECRDSEIDLEKSWKNDHCWTFNYSIVWWLN